MGYKLNVGAAYENATYLNSTYNKISTPAGITTIDFNSKLGISKYALFARVSKGMFDERLILSLGARTDFTDYSKEMENPANQFSPRFSLAWNLTDAFSFNFNIGRYYQLPAYTILGYRDSSNVLENKFNKVKYISNDQVVAGFEYNTKINTKITIEGFYKLYNNYPLALRDSISLANLGGDYGVIGNEPVSSINKGRAYGLELMLQQKLYKGFYGIVSLTLVTSEFQNKKGKYIPSSWDNKSIASFTFGKKFKKNWELGVKWRYQGGTPYTPIDVQTSSLKTVWDISGRGISDYNQLNSVRLKPYHQLDWRIDKKVFFKKWSLDVYFDIQNAYKFQSDQPPILLLDKDENGNPQTDPNNPAAYKTKMIANPTGTLLETLGIIVEF